MNVKVYTFQSLHLLFQNEIFIVVFVSNIYCFSSYLGIHNEDSFSWNTFIIYPFLIIFTVWLSEDLNPLIIPKIYPPINYEFI